MHASYVGKVPNLRRPHSRRMGVAGRYGGSSIPPITVFLRAMTLTEPSVEHIDPLLIHKLIALTDDILSEITEAGWKRNLERWRKTKPGHLPRCHLPRWATIITE
jgi:hypothetical protein